MEKADSVALNLTFWSESQDVLPSSFLGMQKPDGGFFLTTVDLSSGVPSRLFEDEDQEDVQRLGGVVYRYELDAVLGQAKSFMKTRNFKTLSSSQEVDHGVMFWHIDDEKTFVLIASTDRNTDLTDEALSWLGATHQSYETRLDGFGPIDTLTLPPEAQVLQKVSPKTVKIK